MRPIRTSSSSRVTRLSFLKRSQRMKLRVTIWTLGLALAGCATAARAQVQDQNSQSQDPSGQYPATSSTGSAGTNRKMPAGAARGVSGPNDLQSNDPSQVAQDRNTLAGAQFLGLGSLQRAHNIFDPSITVSELGQTVPGAPGIKNLTSDTIVGGSLNFDRTSGPYHLTAIYSGGENILRGSLSGNMNLQFHDLSVSQEIDSARWRLLLRDDFIATPGAAFTGTGLGGPGILAQLTSLESSLNGIGQGFAPSQTIQTGNAMRYSNATLGQVQYSLSRRSTVTLAGSYGVLHFTTPGFLDSHMVTAQAGYDYMIDPADSIGLFGGYGKTDYTGNALSNTTTNYLAGLAFGRKITGRLAFQVGGGPEQIRSSYAAGGGFQIWYAAVNSALTYARRRDGLSLTFLRGLTSGSGVFAGAESYVATLEAHRQFTRYWTGSVTGGYAINNSLAPARSPTFRFDNWFAGASIGRQLGHHFQISLNYGAQRQNSPASCPVTSCGISGLQHTFGMTVSGHLRRIE